LDGRTFVDFVNGEGVKGGGTNDGDEMGNEPHDLENSGEMHLTISSYRPMSGPCNLTATAFLGVLYKFTAGERFEVELEIDDVTRIFKET